MTPLALASRAGPPAFLFVFSLAASLVLGSWPSTGAPMAAVFPPWWHRRSERKRVVGGDAPVGGPASSGLNGELGEGGSKTEGLLFLKKKKQKDF